MDVFRGWSGDGRSRRAGIGLPRAATSLSLVLLLWLLLIPGQAMALDLQAPLGPQDPGTSDRGVPPGAIEVPKLRTRDTTTYVTADDEYITHFHNGSVNYRDASANWQPIENDLVPVFTPGYAYKNKANRYAAEFPSDIRDPVRFSFAGEWATLEMEGASGAGQPDGPRSRFTNALPGVTVDYIAENDALKETLSLAGPSVQRSFRFRLETSDGLTVREAEGGVDFDSGKDVLFSLAPPNMYDSSGSPTGHSNAVDMTVEKAEGGYVLTLTPNSKWLDSKDRVWPVLLDPSFYFRSDAECTIYSLSQSNCLNPNQTYLSVGKASSWSQVGRSLFRFDVEHQVPRDAIVTSANLLLYAATTHGATIGAHEVTRAWDSRVSWTTSDGTTAWTPGGDFLSSPAASTAVSGLPGWYGWQLKDLVNAWVDGSKQNRGVLLKSGEVSGDETTFLSSAYPGGSWPFLSVTWQPRGRYTSSPSNAWIADGGTHTTPRVNALKARDDRVYVGGDFDSFGPRTGSFVSLSTTLGTTYGKVVANVDQVTGYAGGPSSRSAGEVYAITSDGSGGWFIGGEFKYVGSHPRTRLAHIRADGTLDPAFDPQVNGPVYSLALSNGNLYVGGSFSTVNGASRSNLAMLTASNAALSIWNPGPNNTVSSIVVDGSNQMFIGGSFTTVGGIPRKYIAALHPATGVVLPWYPTNGANAAVVALALGDSGTIYAGGAFSMIGGENHAGLAKINTTTGAPISSWAPSVAGSVNALAVSGSTVYVGGQFTSIAGASRNGFAALSGSSGSLVTGYPNPAAGSEIRSIAVGGSMVYLGGSFTQIGPLERRHVAAINTAGPTASVATWNPRMGDSVFALAVSAGSNPRVGVGGRFRTANGVARKNLAAVDPSTGEPTSWNPSVSTEVKALELAEGNLYVGSRSLEAFNTSTGEPVGIPADFMPTDITALRAAHGRLYIGAADFHADPVTGPKGIGAIKLGAGATSNGNPGSYQSSYGEYISWVPQVNGLVYDIETDGNAVYIAGGFSYVGNTQRSGLAAISKDNSAIVYSWNPSPDGPVAEIALTQDALYAAGGFGSLAGQPRSNVGALALPQDASSSAAALPWNPGTDGFVQTIAADDAGVYVGGLFGTVGGVPRKNLAAVSPTGTVLPFSPQTDWSPAPAAFPLATELSERGLYVGGSFYGIGASDQRGVAFFPNYGRLVEPMTGMRTRKRLELKAATEMSFFRQVRFEYCRTDNVPQSPPPCDTSGWAEIPSQFVRDANNEPIEGWPQNVTAGASPTLVWDVAATQALSGTYANGDAKFEVRAVFIDPYDGTTYATSSAKAELNQNSSGMGGATAPIGPGTVDLLTGNYTVTETDVSIDAFGSDFNFTRTWNTRDRNAGGASGPLGPGWKMGMPVDAAASDWAKLELYTDYVEVGEDYVEREYAIITTVDGAEAWFSAQSDGSFHPEPGSEDLKLVRRQESDGSGLRFELIDLDGNVTVFRRPTGAADYLVDEIRQPGSGNTTTFTFYASGKVKEMYAPGANSISCGVTSQIPKRCRYLTFIYEGGGGGTGKLTQIDFTTVSPTSDTKITTTQVKYGYDVTGRLRTVDTIPANPGDPWLRTTYAYSIPNDGWVEGLLTTIDPPGPEAAWTLTYYSEYPPSPPGPAPDAAIAGRLKSVRRFAYENGSATVTGTAETSITYGLPLYGGPWGPSMTPADVAQWGQNAVPTDATAIDPPGSVGPTTYYMDARGREVNVLTPGGGITTTEWDGHDNVTRELSASNRAKALLAASPPDEAPKLDTQRTYSADGRELLSELGPLHEIQREDNGQLALARAHTTIAYDEPPERPDGVERLHLPTTATVGAQLSTGGADIDQRTTKMSYLGESGRGFTLRKPTSTTVDPGGLNLVSRTVYRADGLVAESRMPKANPSGSDAHTTKTYYYEAGSANANDCRTDLVGGRPDWTGLPCQTRPAGQPTAGLPDIPITTYEYNRLYQVDKETEKSSAGTALRISDPQYDDAGRITSEEISSPTSEGTPLSKRFTDYYPDTGRLKKTWVAGSSARIEHQYDPLGRIVRYEEFDDAGSSTNAATTKYDLLDRPSSVFDGKESRTYFYDGTTGYLTGLDDSGLNGSGNNDFTAAYDVDGRPTQVSYPNGLQAISTYDETGVGIALRYVKTGGCGSTCEWLNFTNKESINGQVLSESNARMGATSTKRYSYDKAGRLTEARDTPAGQGCTTRAYNYDADSNRASFISRAPGSGGACVTSGGSPMISSYDEADRLTGSGTLYDTLGRITELPGSFAGGDCSGSPTNCLLTSSYYVNDLVRRQTHEGVTNTYYLDPLWRQNRRDKTAGAQTTSETYHYADDSDAPVWISNGGTNWTREIDGITGDLAAIQSTQMLIQLQLTNLHGDVVATVDTGSATLTPAPEVDEFGVPKQTGELPKFNWLGGKQRRTDLKSGVVQMGVRLYVPRLGRFLQPDPLPGGSDNAYDYAGQDPVNSFDLDGLKKKKKKASASGPRLTRSQKHAAAVIFHVARRRGLSRAHAREMVAASYQESGLNPRSVNASSGAAGLFQLLSKGYVDRAKRLGGVFNAKANTRAILPAYVAYWKAHPNARPGEGAAAVEASGEPASFYAAPLTWLPHAFPCNWRDCE
jgi:RHS repeat-associated protein